MTLQAKLEHSKALAPLTTFGVGGTARWFLAAADEETVAAAVAFAADQLRVPLFVLGGGSNLLVPDGEYPGLVLQVAVRGVESLSEGVYRVGAGENWDALVTRSVADGAAGMECLAGIPGSVGGTPVQNVGAYGQDVSETIVGVRAFDRERRRFVDLDAAACRFRYRQSVFNTEEAGRWIVTRVMFRLRPGGEPTFSYADLRRHFADSAIAPTLADVADAVRGIRRAKGMLIDTAAEEALRDPDTRSAGSFFRNPVVRAERLGQIAAAALVADVAGVPHWPAGDGQVKLPAAWLLERAGFGKGWGEGRVRVSTRHTLALTNRGGATFADVEQVEETIRAGVRERFGVELEREPVVLGRA